jgi:pectin methylesterase-like acyl-CoA thioesterase
MARQAQDLAGTNGDDLVVAAAAARVALVGEGAAAIETEINLGQGAFIPMGASAGYRAA